MNTPTKSTLLEAQPSKSVYQFINRYSQYQNIDKNIALAIITQALKRHKSAKSNLVAHSGYLHNLELRWYNSLKEGIIDYGIYDEDYYFTDLWLCWTIYSRPYLKTLQNNEIISRYLTNVKSIVDLGCGIAYTTASLKQLFPKCAVFGTNLADTKQFEFCKQMSDIYNFDILTSTEEVKHDIDLVVASEYFEHFENPIAEIDKVIKSVNPKFLFIANSFGTYGLGHFFTHNYNGKELPAKEMSKLFNEKLKTEYGYKQIEANIWNNKPSFWVRTNES
jgi:SAM-dependent methyltransferase